MVCSDILSSLELRRFSLFLRFCFHSSRSRQFCGNLLQSSGVAPVLNVASLGISVFPLHASLSACNRDMFQIHSSAKTAEWEHSQPHGEVLSEQSVHGDFSATTSSGNIARSSFVLDSRFAASLIIIVLMFAIHLLPEGRSFLARFLVKLFRGSDSKIYPSNVNRE